jgi:hypothetical protein
MDRKQFVKAVRLYIGESAKKSMIERLGSEIKANAPQNQMLAAKQYYQGLDKEEKDNVQFIVEQSVNDGILGLLAILDGISFLEDGQEKGEFKLYYENGKEKTLLNEFGEGTQLTSLYLF